MALDKLNLSVAQSAIAKTAKKEAAEEAKVEDKPQQQVATPQKEVSANVALTSGGNQYGAIQVDTTQALFNSIERQNPEITKRIADFLASAEKYMPEINDILKNEFGQSSDLVAFNTSLKMLHEKQA